MPPLNYDFVYKLKKDFAKDEIIINGGITDTVQIKDHLEKVDGVMIGRAIYHSPYFLVDDSALDEGVKAMTYLALDYADQN